MRKRTILFLAASPSGTDQLALDREARAIQVELERSGHRDCFELETRWAAEPLDLLRELRKLKPAVIHFSGHVDKLPPRGGEPQHGLLFHGADGRAQVVSTAALVRTIEAAGTSVKLVVLSACYSEAHAEALLARVDCIVGMSGSIHHDAARSFAIGFYGGLGEGESVEAAYKQGCAAISLDGLRDADRPRLKIRNGVDAGQLVLAGDPPSSATAATAVTISAAAFPLTLPRTRPAPAGRPWRRRLLFGAAAMLLLLATLLIGDVLLALVEQSLWNGVLKQHSEDGLQDNLRPVPPGMACFTGAKIRAGIFDASQWPATCATRKATEDCVRSQDPSKISERALDDFCIDKHEVTNRELASWLEDRPEMWRRNIRDPSVIQTRTEPGVFLVRTGEECGLILVDGRVRPGPGKENQPATCMTWMTARDYCRAKNKQLPLELEWELAARGSEGRAFPWGTEMPRHDGVAFDRGDSTDRHPADVGASSQDVSPQGVHDLGGNVAEWVNDEQGSGETATIRGGSWNSRDPCRLLGSSCERVKAEQFSRDVGFRCARRHREGQEQSKRRE